jgi:hypothetical protein
LTSSETGLFRLVSSFGEKAFPGIVNDREMVSIISLFNLRSRKFFHFYKFNEKSKTKNNKKKGRNEETRII